MLNLGPLFIWALETPNVSVVFIIFSLRTEITERSALIVFFGCSNLSIPIDTIDTIDTIYQLFWCSRGAQGFAPFPCIANKCKNQSPVKQRVSQRSIQRFSMSGAFMSHASKVPRGFFDVPFLNGFEQYPNISISIYIINPAIILPCSPFFPFFTWYPSQEATTKVEVS